jgi:acyl-CoA synthetase (AMP-forming)/AMP-acid ligase II
MWNFKEYGDKIAVIDENGKEYTYAWLSEKGDELATQVGGRKLVFCLCSNTVGSLLGYTAFLNHDIVALMLSGDLNESLLEDLVKVYTPDFVWKPVNGEYILEKTEYNNVYQLYSELALLLTTSGSTGSPKVVRQS